ncbi:maltose/maltodextrin ABC transporter substrate-binding protein MalE [Aeromonas caviae]|jgi:maltose/maltodextrin transport system substrate-binding protein|uniref:Maltodextrin-binding protein n=1 Tax=Aeromonas caviae TaxID=648 RepID=A0A3N9Y4Y4_AERCA|nr:MULTISPECIES: maltose/maltodextrin ABC transporter substrate-binding protein MalE [Aeromonas]MDU7311345.1 maltose/maltodextrin ABC transporter substrate-binding protein MalE [Aeromonas sp.]PZQ95532.1 MAG: maltose/maltodextrin ABC transporter substrate-binding protein MalE [Aeromonas media]AUT41248.1 maltose/maltodextrin ABC transporter substrate-binding protein MalE [Aeromonas sp. ASNIH5]AUV18292.1 maltose/maltodextrin ABC transporter substrate-binding protein MalE [Aeromonas sp. ASNIH7]AUZ
MKKKLLSSLIGLATLGVACSATAAIDEGQLTIWINGDKGYNGLAEVGKKFEAETGIKVTVAHPDQVEVKFQQAAATGNGPDIFFWAHDRYGEWVKSGLLVPVTPNTATKAKFEQFAWDAMTVDGKTYGYPVAVEAVSLIYNKDLLPNPPKTFEEIAKIDEDLKKNGKRAIMWAYDTPYFSYPLVAANGGYAFKKTATGYDVKDTGVNNAGAKAGVGYISEMIKSGHLEKGIDYGVMDAKFNKGEVAMMINGPWAWSNLDKSGIKYGVAQLPTLKGKPAKAFVGVLGATINAASPNKDLAIEFLENYLLTDAGLAPMNADKPLGAVALKSFQKTLEADPNIKATMLNAQNGEPMPSVPEMSRFWSSFETALKNITSGRQGVDEALDTAAKRIVQ